MKDLTDERLNTATLNREDVEFFLRCTNEGDIRFQQLAAIVNIEICKWRGWTHVEDNYGWEPNCTRDKTCLGAGMVHLPSHITGIEALGNMHEAEKGLTDEQRVLYMKAIADVVGAGRHSITWRGHWEVICATARQRGIALLRVAKPELFQ